MTSKLTREQLHERARENVKALKMASRQHAFESAREEILADLQLAELALAAMGSEPVAWRQPFTGRCVSSIFYQDGSSPLDHGYEPLYSAPQEPVVPGKWIPVSERMPDVGDIVLTAMGGSVNVGEMERSGANYRYFTSVISGRELPVTHWMPLPAAPQEAINALIPLVSRNEQEVK